MRNAYEALAVRIATFGHDDWQPVFGREIYTDVLYVDCGGDRYYVASLEEAEVLDDSALLARIEAALAPGAREGAVGSHE